MLETLAKAGYTITDWSEEKLDWVWIEDPDDDDVVLHVTITQLPRTRSHF